MASENGPIRQRIDAPRGAQRYARNQASSKCRLSPGICVSYLPFRHAPESGKPFDPRMDGVDRRPDQL